MKNIVSFPVRKRRLSQLYWLHHRRETFLIYGFGIGMTVGVVMAFSMLKLAVICPTH